MQRVNRLATQVTAAGGAPRQAWGEAKPAGPPPGAPGQGAWKFKGGSWWVDDGASEKLQASMGGTCSKLLFENDRVRVSDFRLPSNQEVTCTHTYPTVRWQVCSSSAATETVREKCSSSTEHELNGKKEILKDKQVFFAEAGQAWTVKNTDPSKEYRQMIFELKSSTPKRSEAENASRLKRAIYSTDVGTELMFENHLCRVWDFSLPKGTLWNPKTSTHHHVLDYAFVYCYKGRLLGYHHDGKPGLFDSTNEENDVSWNDLPEDAPENPKCAHGGSTDFQSAPRGDGWDDIDMREYLVELK